MLVYLFGLLTAFSNAGANILQRSASKREPRNLQFSWALIHRLVMQPLWLGGTGLAILSFVFQANGLSIGSLATVQLLMMLELPLTLLGDAAFLGAALRPREWLSISMMTAGVIGLIAALNPQKGGSESISLSLWIIGTCASAGLVIVLYVGSKATRGNRQAVLLGAATGVAFGMAAALLKGVIVRFQQDGLAGALSAWQFYLAFAAGVSAMWLYQYAIHGGQLVAAQPGVTLLDPCVAILWGSLVFHEPMRGGFFIPLAVLALGLMAAGSIMLAGSPAFSRRK